MSYIQVIDYETTRGDEMESLLDDWRNRTEGRRSTVTSVTTRDRDNPNHYLTIVEFPSYDDAMTNSAMPETSRFAEQMTALCSKAPSYLNLDVIRQDKA
jgi:hypothetical protein